MINPMVLTSHVGLQNQPRSALGTIALSATLLPEYWPEGFLSELMPLIFRQINARDSAVASR